MRELDTKPVGELTDHELLAEVARIYALPADWVLVVGMGRRDALPRRLREKLCIVLELADRHGFDGERKKRSR